jgi:uncharacterized protein YbaA (DUF1428 family)
MSYVDGYLLVVPNKNLPAYKRMAMKASKIWREHGALEYRECAADDLKSTFGIPFGKLLKVRKGETVIFAWAIFKSRAARDRVNMRVMKDPRLAAMCDPKSIPFDMKRMSWGGFKTLVRA